MKKWLMAAALVAVASVSAHAGQGKSHHGKRHHTHAAAASYPDSVTQDGKEYKVCKQGVEDDCIQPRQAGLGFGNRPTHTYRPDAAEQHP